MDFAVAAADAITDEEIVVSGSHAQTRAAIIHKIPMLFDLNTPALHVFLNKTASIVAFAEIFNSQASTVFWKNFWLHCLEQT